KPYQSAVRQQKLLPALMVHGPAEAAKALIGARVLKTGTRANPQNQKSTPDRQSRSRPGWLSLFSACHVKEFSRCHVRSGRLRGFEWERDRTNRRTAAP